MSANYINAVFVAAAAFAVACMNRPLCDEDCRPRTTNQFVTKVAGSGVDKIDLLFMIDNSSSMDDKQKVLQEAVPDLVQRLVNPNCVDPNGAMPSQQATSPEADCPSPLLREFVPIRDIHVGIVTSSLGDHGDGSGCKGDDSDPVAQEMNDHGWLIGTRSRFSVPPGGQGIDKAGFLDWNPTTHQNESLDAFNTTFEQMTVATGSTGCGYEAQLESIYRFLVDPHPYNTIVLQDCPGTHAKCAYPTGIDQQLLSQRAAFLRPDSLVAIIMLTDENDCSVRESGQGFYATTNTVLPHATSICATNPNDHCCYSCGAGKVPDGCAKDPVCDTPVDQPPGWDDPNLRCFHQVQRFGADLLYPTARYVNAFTQQFLCTSQPSLAPADATCPDADNDRMPDIVANPLFDTKTAVPRDASLVFFAGIIGVPWQDIATSKNPDGGDYPSTELHYQTAKQLADNGTWDAILGNGNPGMGQAPVPPIDTLMQESQGQRSGNDGENPPKPLADPSAGLLANPVNGHEWLSGKGDLQYACIFKLKGTDEKTCPATDASCPCRADELDSKNPLCQDASGGYSQPVQRFAKAYPGVRELQVLKDMGKNSIVASICARNLENKGAQDYGYRPAVDAIVERLKEALTGSCLPRQLVRDASGKLPCSVVEARPIPMTGQPACTATPGRLDPNPNVIAPAISQLKSSGMCDVANKPPCSTFYVCEIAEAGPDCHTGDKPSSPGWCYIDPANQADDNPGLVKQCPATEKRAIRFVDPDHRTPEHDAIALVACFGAAVPDEAPAMSSAVP